MTTLKDLISGNIQQISNSIQILADRAQNT